MSIEEMSDQLKKLVNDLRTLPVLHDLPDDRVPQAMDHAATAIENLHAERDSFMDALIIVRREREEAERNLRDLKVAYADLSIQLVKANQHSEKQAKLLHEEYANMGEINARLAPLIATLRDWAENENPTVDQALALAGAWNTWKETA